MTRINMILLAFLAIAPVAAADPVDSGDFTHSSERRRIRLGKTEQDSLQELIDWLFGHSRSRWGWESIRNDGEPRGHVLPTVLPWLGKGVRTYPVHLVEPTPSIRLVNPPETPPPFLPHGFDPPFPPGNPPIPGPVPTITPPGDPIPNPEPGTLILIGMGAAGLAYRKRRRARP